MSALAALIGAETRRLGRRTWILVAATLGLLLALVVHGVAATHEDLTREDSLRRGAATLLLLGGLALAIALGSAALNNDSQNGHFGFLVGSGASRPQVVAGVTIAMLASPGVTGSGGGQGFVDLGTRGAGLAHRGAATA